MVRKIIATLLGMTIIGFIVYNTYLKRSPEKILKQQFNISLRGFDYNIESFEEQWSPNGDGHLLLIIKLKNLTKENIDYFYKYHIQLLPISNEMQHQMVPNSIPNSFLRSRNGYYLYECETDDIRDFKIFIFDTVHNRALLYYQIM